MNIYCSKCKRELEIEKDLGSEIHVFSCGCEDTASAVAEARREALNDAEKVCREIRDACEDAQDSFGRLAVEACIDNLYDLEAGPCTPEQIGSDLDYQDFKRTENNNLASMR